MPDRDLITIILTTSMGTDEWEMEVPHDVRAQALINKVIRTEHFGFKANDDAGNPIPYRLLWKEGERYLAEGESLRAANVESGHTIVMAHEARAGTGTGAPTGADDE
jgi:hypothetical protein